MVLYVLSKLSERTVEQYAHLKLPVFFTHISWSLIAIRDAVMRLRVVNV